MKYLLFLVFFILSSNSFSENKNFFLFGKKFYEEKNFIKAQIEFEKSIVFNSKHVDSYVYLAKVFLEFKNSDEEKKNLKTALLLDPKNEEALYLISELYIKEGDYKNAENNYNLLSFNCTKFCNKIETLKLSIANFKN